MDKRECIAENLQKARKKCGYSYQQLADKTGLSKSTLQRYESGAIQNLSLGKAEQLAQALNITPAELLGWQELNQYKELGDLDRLRELAQADREGRCVVLPFSVGACVYVAGKFSARFPGAVIPHKIRDIQDAINFLSFWMKTVFPDEKSAEKAENRND